MRIFNTYPLSDWGPENRLIYVSDITERPDYEWEVVEYLTEGGLLEICVTSGSGLCPVEMAE